MNIAMTTRTKAIRMIDDFLLRALIAGVVISLAAAPLGCLVVWRRMAYFGDATGHAGLLGVALGLAFNLPMTLGVAILAGAMALVVTYMMRRGDYAVDTVLGVFAHSALAIGLVAASLLPGVRINLIDTLMGDILSVSWPDIALISFGATGIIGVMAWRWRNLLNGTLSPELLVAEGGSLLSDRLIFYADVGTVCCVGNEVGRCSVNYGNVDITSGSGAAYCADA